MREPSRETLPRPTVRAVLEVLLFMLVGVLGYVAVVLTVQMLALRRQIDSFKNIEGFLVQWLSDFQDERHAGTLEVAAETRALRRTALLFLKMVVFSPASGSTYSDNDLRVLIEGIKDQDERLTG